MSRDLNWWERYLHAIAQPKLACRAHLRLRRVKLWFSANTDVLVYLTNTLHVVEIASIQALVDFLLNDEVLASGLSVCLYVGICRRWNNMRHPFAAHRVEDVYVKDARCGVVPCCGCVGVFVYVLNCMVG